MRISMLAPFDPDGLRATVDRIGELERNGLDIVWVGEPYGFDAPTTLAFLAARTERVQLGAGILPIYSRTPTLTAMTAAGLDFLSNGRAILGLGASGPQVVEGWHGVPYDKPLQRTREIVDIARKVWRREVVAHDGRAYQLPLPDGQGVGLGKPLKLIVRPLRPDIPIYIAALGAKTVEFAAATAEGWLPLFFAPDAAHQVWGEALAAATPRPSATWPGRRSRSTSAAWGRAATTSTTTCSRPTATRRKRARSRTCTSTARSARPRRPSRTRSSSR
jgi:F420-dependent oxidoreductase-like protein